jgi:simple sugar transport system ATP-binding protein/ribose transport system ATP-binding protein
VPAPPGHPLLETREISKRFGGVRAVVDASLSIAPGSVHGLVGENGAGKSTLAKVIAGVYQPDTGDLFVDGQPMTFHSPRDALAAGIATIAQEIALVPARTVEENVLLGLEPNIVGFLRGREQHRRFVELNERTGFRLRAGAVVGELRTAEQQKVEILRAMARDARLIVMDEPTAALTGDESEH